MGWNRECHFCFTVTNSSATHYRTVLYGMSQMSSQFSSPCILSILILSPFAQSYCAQPLPQRLGIDLPLHCIVAKGHLLLGAIVEVAVRYDCLE